MNRDVTMPFHSSRCAIDMSSGAEDVLVAAEALTNFTQRRAKLEPPNRSNQLHSDKKLRSRAPADKRTARKDTNINSPHKHMKASACREKQTCHYLLSKAFPRKVSASGLLICSPDRTFELKFLQSLHAGIQQLNFDIPLKKQRSMCSTICQQMSSRCTCNRQLLEMLSQEDVSHAISWLPDGKTFVILNAKTLTEDVLPRFFKPTKFDSFLRKLNRWGFRRVNKHGARLMFSHDTLHRGTLDVPRSRRKPLIREHAVVDKVTADTSFECVPHRYLDGFPANYKPVLAAAKQSDSSNIQENAKARHLLDILMLSKLEQLPPLYRLQLDAAAQTSLNEGQENLHLKTKFLIRRWEELNRRETPPGYGGNKGIVRAAIDVLRTD